MCKEELTNDFKHPRHVKDISLGITIQFNDIIYILRREANHGSKSTNQQKIVGPGSKPINLYWQNKIIYQSGLTNKAFLAVIFFHTETVFK